MIKKCGGKFPDNGEDTETLVPKSGLEMERRKEGLGKEEEEQQAGQFPRVETFGKNPRH